MKAEHNSIFSGSAMAVLGGIVLMIAPWFVPIVFYQKLLIALFGLVIFLVGLRSSKG
jgi:hypothetical protein